MLLRKVMCVTSTSHAACVMCISIQHSRVASQARGNACGSPTHAAFVHRTDVRQLTYGRGTLQASQHMQRCWR